MIALQGTGVSAGIVSGPILFYEHMSLKVERYTVQDPEAELCRWEQAVNKAADELDGLYRKAFAEAGEESAALFETHKLMLGDLDYNERIRSLILQDKINAQAAVKQAAKEFSQMFSNMDDEYMQARSVDVIDISDRVISVLNNGEAFRPQSKEPCIIVCDDLTPSETVQLDKSLVLGFLLTKGNANSHTAILARTLGIPAIINVNGEIKKDFSGRNIIIDGSVGYAVIDPDDATKEYLFKKQREENAVRDTLEKLKGQPDVTADGRKIKLYANINNTADVDAVITNDARGIGLFRSEFLYLEENDYPCEAKQFEAYKSVVRRMGGKRVIIRTLDIGADKNVEYFKLSPEKNPALGLRAIRLCLNRPDIFKTQLRALYRASAYGKLAVMFPMITSLWEVREAKRTCAAVKNELAKERILFDENLEIGVMIETPAAVMVADEIAKEVDFFSIGTNDLTQYTLAADRQGAAGMERFYDSHHPAVMKMIKMTVDAAHKNGIWAGVCGELASDLSVAGELLGLGVDELSVSPRSVLPLRNLIRNTNIGQIVSR